MITLQRSFILILLIYPFDSYSHAQNSDCEINGTIIDFKAAVPRCSERHKILYNYGLDLLKQEKYQSAISLYKYLLIDLSEERAAHLLIKAKLLFGEDAKIPKEVKTISSEIRLNILKELLSAEKFEDLKDFIARFPPETSQEFQVSAKFHFKNQDYAQSLEHFKKGCEIESDCSAEELLSLAISYERLNQFKESQKILLDLFETKISSVIDSELLINHLVYTAIKIENVIQIIDLIKKKKNEYLALIEEDKYNNYLLAVYAKDKERFLTEATEFLARKFKFSDKSSEIRANLTKILGFIYLEKGLHDMAKKQLEASSKLRPDYQTYYYLAVVAYKNKDYDSAKKNNKRALQLNRNYQDAITLSKTLDKS